MAIRSLNLDVRRPDGRQVRVRIIVLPLVGVRKELETSVPSGVHAIDADQLEPPSALLGYLERLTAGEPDGAVLRAAIFEPDLGTLLDGLGAHPPPPDPIIVRLSK
jgi:hypothetical protein